LGKAAMAPGPHFVDLTLPPTQLPDCMS
jgi:hypothetical protein